MGMSLQEWKRYFTDMPGLDALVGRVSTSGRRPVFMVGSGLSLPEKQGGPGVPGGAGMIDLIRSRLSDDEAALDALKGRLDQVAEEDASVYGAAFELLSTWRGQDAVNKVVSDAVLGARLPGARQSENPRVLEEDLEGWALNRGTRALGSLLAEHRESYPEPAVLTTNFDPLISIAINRANGRSHPIFLNGDRPLPSMAELKSDETPIMHLHGYWRGVDTQHTWMELTASRPQLGASLARLLDNRLVVVVGYEGWDDAFMRAVALLLADPVAQPDIVWAVYHVDPGKLVARPPQVQALRRDQRQRVLPALAGPGERLNRPGRSHARPVGTHSCRPTARVRGALRRIRKGVWRGTEGARRSPSKAADSACRPERSTPTAQRCRAGNLALHRIRSTGPRAEEPRRRADDATTTGTYPERGSRCQAAPACRNAHADPRPHPGAGACCGGSICPLR